MDLDNSVVRLYSVDVQGELMMETGKAIILSPQGEGHIPSGPLRVQGNLEDYEALVVVAATESADYGRLAPAAGTALTETIEQAPGGGRSLVALAMMALSRISVIMLSYQVRLQGPSVELVILGGSFTENWKTVSSFWKDDHHVGTFLWASSSMFRQPCNAPPRDGDCGDVCGVSWRETHIPNSCDAACVCRLASA